MFFICLFVCLFLTFSKGAIPYSITGTWFEEINNKWNDFTTLEFCVLWVVWHMVLLSTTKWCDRHPTGICTVNKTLISYLCLFKSGACDSIHIGRLTSLFFFFMWKDNTAHESHICCYAFPMKGWSQNIDICLSKIIGPFLWDQR